MAGNQFSLLRSRRFAPLFIAQWFGAFTDNVFKSAVLILLVFKASAPNAGATLVSGVNAATSAGHADLLANIAAGIFVLPFFFLSATAGQFADRYDKAWLIRAIKVAEIGVALVASLALASESSVALILVLALLGCLSAFFGPVKFAILPQHLQFEELIGGNALIESGTFLAILVGTILGGVLATTTNGTSSLSMLLIGSAIIGLLASLFVPSAPSPNASLKINLNLLSETWNALQLARSRRTLFLAILGVSWFWLIGSAYLTQVPNYTRIFLGGDASVVTLLLCSFTVGITLGSLLCERLSGRTVEIGLVPIGSTGLSLFAFDAYFQTFDHVGITHHWKDFLFSTDGGRLCFDFVMMGAFGGCFVVPLNAMIQSRAPEGVRARIIAMNNILNALFMTLAALFAILMLSVVKLGINELFLVLAVMNLAVAWFIYHQVPEFSARFLIWALSHTMYRVTHRGLANIPERGGAVLVCNHVSFVDALLIAGAVRRPVRFIMFKPIYDTPVLNFVFRAGRAIPINTRRDDPAAYEQAFIDMRAGLNNGDLLCIFPEGKLTRDGQIDEFRPGIERIIGETPVPVVPMALKGLWGSWFSPEGGGAFAKRPKRFWSKVEIVAGMPIAPEAATAAHLRELVVQLRGQAA